MPPKTTQKASRFDKPNDSSSNKKSEELTSVRPLDAMPVLRMTSNHKQTNYMAFKVAFREYITSTFGKLASAFDEGSTGLFREPNVEMYDINDCRDEDGNIDQGAVARADYRFNRAQVKRDERVGENDDDYVKIYGILKNQISRESKDAVAKLPEYEAECEAIKNPFNLWKALEKVHLTCVTADSVSDKIEAQKVYNEIKQLQNETLVEYKTRFETAYKAAVVLNMPVEDAATQVRRFVDGMFMNPVQAQYKVHCKNLLTCGKREQYPANITTAMQEAERWVAVKVESKETQENVFVISASDSKPWKKKREKKSKGKEDRKDDRKSGGK